MKQFRYLVAYIYSMDKPASISMILQGRTIITTKFLNIKTEELLELEKFILEDLQKQTNANVTITWAGVTNFQLLEIIDIPEDEGPINIVNL